jgi:predicted ATP-binding protein involved in virulence
MYLKSIKLHNFRCYENLSVDFNSEFTILVGDNGAGKSALLDAVSIALGSYIAGLDGVASNSISQDDVHLKTYELGSRYDSQKQFPTEIEAECNVDGASFTWKRGLYKEKGRTHISDARSIMNYAADLQKGIRKGDTSIILPIIAYYGTGRLYMQKKDRTVDGNKTNFSRTTGYDTCLESASNARMMMKWFEQMTTIQLQEGQPIPELEAVKKAMAACYAGAGNSSDHIHFNYMVKSKEIEISYIDHGVPQKMPMKMLSDGVRSTISMVADIAYRMAVLNPQLFDSVLENTPGVVLIDELDMHLHPSWQARIMDDLRHIFPKVQFIVTTHSPSVLTNVKKEHILLLKNHEIFNPINTTYGRKIESILSEIMDVNVRPKEVRDLIEDFYKTLSDEDYSKAKELLNNLISLLGEEDSDVVEAKVSYSLESE